MNPSIPTIQRLTLSLTVAFLLNYTANGQTCRVSVHDRGPCPDTADGVCVPNRRDFGFYATKWRRWPGRQSPGAAADALDPAEAVPSVIKPFLLPPPEEEETGLERPEGLDRPLLGGPGAARGGPNPFQDDPAPQMSPDTEDDPPEPGEDLRDDLEDQFPDIGTPPNNRSGAVRPSKTRQFRPLVSQGESPVTEDPRVRPAVVYDRPGAELSVRTAGPPTIIGRANPLRSPQPRPMGVRPATYEVPEKTEVPARQSRLRVNPLRLQ